MTLSTLLKEVKTLKGATKDRLLKIIPVNETWTVSVNAPRYKTREKLTAHFKECRVISISGRVRAILICSKQFSNVIIYEGSKTVNV